MDSKDKHEFMEVLVSPAFLQALREFCANDLQYQSDLANAIAAGDWLLGRQP